MVINKQKIFIVSLLFFLSFSFFAEADQVGEKRSFFVESSYDKSERKEISAVLVKATPGLYFYIDEKWWDFSPHNDIYQALGQLGEEFEKIIYPGLTSAYGFEWTPGIDKDKNITILLHPMKENASGYFRTEDEYSRIEASHSNQREMIYLNADQITSGYAKSFLAHEFTHLITFNQKDKIYGVEEEVWLNEARAEYAPTLLGYDDEFKGSYLEQRVNVFLKEPSDSLTEWQAKSADYGALNLFFQYLVDQYGKQILIESLHSSKIGIPSLNEALQKNGFTKDFSQIFEDWVVAVLFNDCSLETRYCYQNKNLKDLRVVPLVNYLPMTGESTLSVTDNTKVWEANWYKFVGGKGDLNFEFLGNNQVDFKLIYIIRNIDGEYKINTLSLAKNEKLNLSLKDFGIENVSLTIIPLIENKIVGFNGFVPIYRFSWSASIVRAEEKNKSVEEQLMTELRAQVEQLKKQITEAQAKIAAILSEPAVAGNSHVSGIPENFVFINNLGLGMTSREVRYLQIFLNSDKITQLVESGPGSSGKETNYFGSLTQAAVIKFQEKYASEILTPLGLINGTGFVGNNTRFKLNELLEE